MLREFILSRATNQVGFRCFSTVLELAGLARSATSPASCSYAVVLLSLRWVNNSGVKHEYVGVYRIFETGLNQMQNPCGKYLTKTLVTIKASRMMKTIMLFS